MIFRKHSNIGYYATQIFYLFNLTIITKMMIDCSCEALKPISTGRPSISYSPPLPSHGIDSIALDPTDGRDGEGRGERESGIRTLETLAHSQTLKRYNWQLVYTICLIF